MPLDFLSLAPPPDLAGGVRFFYRMRIDEGCEHMPNHPQGAVDVIFLLRGSLSFDKGPGGVAVRSRGTVVVPLQTRFFRFGFEAGTRILGVAFSHRGFRRCIDFPLSEFSDACVDLEAAGFAAFGRLRSQLQEVGPRRDLARLIAWLRRRQTRELRDHIALRLSAATLWARAGTSVTTLADELAISPRSLQRFFRSELGIRPKAALRIARFQQVIRSLRRSPRLPWADLALEYGYFDQAHLIRDFRQFTGSTPRQFLRLRPPLVRVFDRAREMPGG